MVKLIPEESIAEPCVSKLEKQAAIAVTFYTKAGCHLCEDARNMLDEIAAETAYELTEIDIRSDPAIFEQYRYRIPVLLIRSGAQEKLLEGRIQFSELAEAFHIV